jgi:ribosomal protein L44E
MEQMGRTSNSSYLGFPCTNCKQPVIALTIPRDMATPRMGGGVMHLQCSHCGRQDDYSTHQVRRFEIEQIAG